MKYWNSTSKTFLVGILIVLVFVITFLPRELKKNNPISSLVPENKEIGSYHILGLIIAWITTFLYLTKPYVLF